MDVKLGKKAERCYINSCSWTKVNKNGALYCGQEPQERESSEKKNGEREWPLRKQIKMG